MVNDIELLTIDEGVSCLLPTCFLSIYTKATLSLQDSPDMFLYSKRYKSREFASPIAEKPISKIYSGGPGG